MSAAVGAAPAAALDVAAARRRLRLAVGRRRRLVAALLAALATAAGLHAVRPQRLPVATGLTVPVLVAARDLPAGRTLTAGDLRVEAMPTALVPSGALRRGNAFAGRVTAAAARRGEPFTDARLVGPGLLGADQAAAGLVATPVRIADPAVAALLRPGDHVDVLAAPTGAGGTTAGGTTAGGSDATADGVGAAGATAGGGADSVVTAAADAVVLAVPRTGDADRVGGDDGALLVLATSPTSARLLAQAAVTARLSVTLGAGTGR